MNKKLYALFLFCFLYSTASARTKLYTFYTPSHEVFYKDWFLPSVSALDEYDLVVEVYDQECETAVFMEKGWISTMKRKVKMMQRAVQENWGSWFVYSDVDIQFFRSTVAEISKALAKRDIVFQQDVPGGYVCAGFFACKANSNTERFWKMVEEYMENHPGVSDQPSVNALLKQIRGHGIITWGILPTTFFGAGTLTGHAWKPGDALHIPHNIIIHHANHTVGIDNKIEQLMLVKSLASGS